MKTTNRGRIKLSLICAVCDNQNFKLKIPILFFLQNDVHNEKNLK